MTAPRVAASPGELLDYLSGIAHVEGDRLVIDDELQGARCCSVTGDAGSGAHQRGGQPAVCVEQDRKGTVIRSQGEQLEAEFRDAGTALRCLYRDEVERRAGELRTALETADALNDELLALDREAAQLSRSGAVGFRSVSVQNGYLRHYEYHRKDFDLWASRLPE